MTGKRGRRNRVLLSVLLSMALLVEPIGTAAVVHAENDVENSAQTEISQEDNENKEDDENVDADSGDDGKTDGDSQKPNDGGVQTDPSEEDDKDDEDSEGQPEEDTDKDPEENPEENPDKDPEEKPEENPGEDSEEDPDEETGDLEEDFDGEGDSQDLETVSGNGDLLEEEEEEKEGLEGFSEMPSTYQLTREQMDSKRELSAYLGEIDTYEEGSDYVKGEVITFAENEEEAEMIAEAYHAEIVSFEYGILTLKLHKSDSVSKAMRAAANEEFNLPAVWPNYYRYAFSEENVIEESITDNNIEIVTEEYEGEEDEDVSDTEVAGTDYTETDYLSVLSYNDECLRPASASYQWHHTVVGSAYAWTEGYTGRGITVAVLDTGVDTNHGDLSATSIYSNGTSDGEGHGTHVAGIIGAKAGNGIGGAGVAPEVTLLSGNVLPDGSGKDSEIMAAIVVACERDADIINMSLGGIGYNGAFQEVVDQAYANGTAVFAAAGNDGGTNYDYPACYDHVISVAATDKGNTRASFSNYGDKVDLSAPGASIWSTGWQGQGSREYTYVEKSGTSMACPVAAGEAAVILSSNIEGVRDKSGTARVDALEKLMKANAVKIGSGMGSGITSLTKVFKLNTAVQKPKAPSITITPDNKSAAQKVTVTITKPQNGTTIYYTINGKNPVYKNGEPDANTMVYETPFVVNDRAKATIKAIAVNESGVAGPVKSATYTLKPYVTSIAISGIQQVAKGKSIQLSAEVLPAYATNKKVTWELYESDGRTKIDPSSKDKAVANASKAKGVSISASGKVTATAKAVAGSYIVRVTAKDAGQVRADDYQITVIDAVKVNTVKFKAKNVNLTIPMAAPDPNADLASIFEALEKDKKTSVPVTEFKWSSNNTSIATVNDKGVVTPLKAGKATITALAKDSSGKKATVTVTIKQLATGIEITGNDKIAAGKSLTFKAELAPADTTVKKVKWELYNAAGKKIDLKDKANAKWAKEQGVSINETNGKLTTTAKAVAGKYTVKAITTDGTNIEDTKEVTVKKGIVTGITFEKKEYSKVTIFRKPFSSVTPTSATVKAIIAGTGDADLGYTVTNSNKGIATVTDSRNGNTVTLTIRATGKAAGKTNITIAATDGSGKKLTCAVTVNNPVSGITVAPTGGNNKCVAQGKSLQLKATVETEYGTIANKGVTWELYRGNRKVDPRSKVKADADWAKSLGVSISASGKITAAGKSKKSVGAVTGPYLVKAVAKDGSGAVGQYEISVGEATQVIALCNNMGMPISTKKVLSLEPCGLEEIYPLYIRSDMRQGSFAVSSSNPSVASISCVDLFREGTGYIAAEVNIYTRKVGKATITIKAMDGSGKQVKYSCVVKAPKGK